MPRLAIARKDQIDGICRESHALWGGGLSLEAYQSFWNELNATPWATKYLTYYAWLDDGDRVLSSFKLYRPRVWMLDRTSRACVLGAVFTPQAHRRQRHALDMMRAVLEKARQSGDDPALLFSDIGTRYYAGLGFRALPAEETWGRMGRTAPASPAGWELRAVRPGDLDDVVRAHDSWCRRRSLAVLRDLEHWQFLTTRAAGFFARLREPGLGQQFRVALYRGRFAGYLITVEGQGEWSIREVGAEKGDPEIMAMILRAGVALAHRAGFRRIYGWLPREVTERLAEWRLKRGARGRAIPMVLPLNGNPDLSALDRPDAAFLPYQDQF